MYLKLIICFLLFITITSNSPFDWQKFKRDYNKQYTSVEEETERKQIFLKNVNRIKDYQRTHPDATFTIGINHLTDRRIEELVTGSKSFFNIRSTEIEKPIQLKSRIPISLDWRDKGVITSIYSEAEQENDATIVAVEVMESYQAIRTKKLIKGSTNQVSACCQNTLDILDCILDKMNGSICADYDYNSSSTICNQSACQPFAVFNHIKKLSSANENTMLTWIQDSPLYVAIDGSESGFLSYHGGIYSDRNCSKRNLDHTVQLVGYGIANGIPYWLCKNSWGAGWGERGYVRIERGRNMCGIATYVVQIEYKTNNAVQLFTFNVIYLILFCVVLHLFSNLK